MQQLLADALSDNGAKGHAARAKLAGMRQMGAAALAEFSEFFPAATEGEEEELNVVDAEDTDDDGFSAEAMLEAPVKDVVDTLLQESKAEEIGFYSTHDEHGLVFVIHVPEGTEKSEIKALGKTLWDVVEEEL